jgi:NAD(P)-dependent dehydrogenase (short-subunit alcohol dehydrogenase family)
LKRFSNTFSRDWDDIISIHLTSAFKLSQAVFPFMKQNKFGKIVNTTSASGLYGNFGQVNYSAAKMGLVGLTKSIAIEGRKSNVHANAIAPLAASRMTEKVFPSVMLEKMDPKFVMPLVLPRTGQIEHAQTKLIVLLLVVNQIF